MQKQTTGRKRKTLKAFRFRDQIIDLLDKLSEKTGKTQTRILEEALSLHASTIRNG